MISKILKGVDARGLIAYMFAAKDSEGRAREKIVDLGGTIAGSNVAEISSQFRALASLRPRLKKNTAHLMLRWTDEDRPTPAEQVMMAKRHAENMGFRHWRGVSHGDHIHIAGSRVNADRTIVSDSADYLKGETSRAELEIKFDLVRVAASHLRDPEQRLFHVTALSREELALAQKGEPSVRMQLQLAVSAALGSGATFPDFANELWALGVEVRPNLQSTGRVAGLSFSLNGMEMTGSNLGRSFSWATLKKKGLDYDQTRDSEIVSECLDRVSRGGDREGRRQNNGPDTGGEGDFGAVVATDCDIFGQPFDRCKKHPGIGFENDVGASESVCRENHQGDAGSREVGDILAPGVAGCAEPSDAGCAVRAASRQIPSPSSLDSRGGFCGDRGNSADAVLSRNRQSDRKSAVDAAQGAVDLVGVIDAIETPGQAVQKWDTNMAPQHACTKPDSISRSGIGHLAASAAHRVSCDYTLHQVRRQVEGLGCAALEIGIIAPKHRLDLKAQAIRVFSALQLFTEKVVKWLKRMNLAGYDIYCRPSIPLEGMRHPLIFVDDLSADKIEKMKLSGLPVAVLVESSPANFHGWVRVGENQISADEALCAARTLSSLFGGDPGAVNSRQFGRLSGFTNKKLSHDVSGSGPFAMLRASTTTVAPAGPEFLATVRSAMVKSANLALADRRRIATNVGVENCSRTAVAAFLSARAKIQVLRADGVPDESAADFGAAASMRGDGWQSSEIVSTILLASPNIDGRHRDVRGYAERTVAAAERTVAVKNNSSYLVPVLRPK